MGAGHVHLFGDGAVFAASDSAGVATVIQNNSSGIAASDHSSVGLFPRTTVTANTGDGVILEAGSEGQFDAFFSATDVSVTNNGGHGVRIGDLSMAAFRTFSSGPTITGNNRSATTPYDVVCDPVFSTTRGFANLIGATTNCPAEQPRNP